MSLDKKLYVAEWADFLGIDQKVLAGRINTSETHMSRIAGNKLKRGPHQETVDGIVEVFRERYPGFSAHMLRFDPIEWHGKQGTSFSTPAIANQVADCIEVGDLTGDQATIDGKPLTPEEQRQFDAMMEVVRASIRRGRTQG